MGAHEADFLAMSERFLQESSLKLFAGFSPSLTAALRP